MPSLRDLSLFRSHAARGFHSSPLLLLTQLHCLHAHTSFALQHTYTISTLQHTYTVSALQLADTLFSAPSLAGALFNNLSVISAFSFICLPCQLLAPFVLPLQLSASFVCHFSFQLRLFATSAFNFVCL